MGRAPGTVWHVCLNAALVAALCAMCTLQVCCVLCASDSHERVSALSHMIVIVRFRRKQCVCRGDGPVCQQNLHVWLPYSSAELQAHFLILTAAGMFRPIFKPLNPAGICSTIEMVRPNTKTQSNRTFSTRCGMRRLATRCGPSSTCTGPWWGCGERRRWARTTGESACGTRLRASVCAHWVGSTERMERKISSRLDLMYVEILMAICNDSFVNVRPQRESLRVGRSHGRACAHTGWGRRRGRSVRGWTSCMLRCFVWGLCMNSLRLVHLRRESLRVGRGHGRACAHAGRLMEREKIGSRLGPMCAQVLVAFSR